jgi:biopolymer transport protein ExbD
MTLRSRAAEDPTINLTPMIDVVFLLVIFFMVGTKFGEQEGRIDVDLPGVGQLSSMSRGPDERIIDVGRSGELALDGRPVDLPTLRQELARARQAFPGLRVVVRGDSAGTLQGFTEVLQVCRYAGIEQMGIGVRTLR